jgi:6-phosphofructokinase 1
LATRFGYEAVRLVEKGIFGKMVALQGSQMRAIPIAKAVGKLKKVPLKYPLLQAARAVGTSFGDE